MGYIWDFNLRNFKIVIFLIVIILACTYACFSKLVGLSNVRQWLLKALNIFLIIYYYQFILFIRDQLSLSYNLTIICEEVNLNQVNSFFG